MKCPKCNGDTDIMVEVSVIEPRWTEDVDIDRLED